jgi:hypothetical protein
MDECEGIEMKHQQQKMWQAATCLLCAVMTWRIPATLAGGEFSGGSITGSLLTFYESSTYVFLLALLLTFVYQRIAAAVALIASFFCLPLYLYVTVPGFFRRVFGGEYSTPLQANFVWNRWAIIGILSVAVAVYVCLRGLVATRTVLRPTGPTPVADSSLG